MTYRVLVIFMCICIVGINAVPASWLPCCCKAKQDVGLEGCSRSVHTRGAASTCMADCGERDAPCCVPEDRGASGGSLAPLCSSCRCIEQMKLVGATGGSGGSESVQPSQGFNSEPLERDESLLLPHHIGAPYLSIAPLILKANLKTCSFLF